MASLQAYQFQSERAARRKAQRELEEKARKDKDAAMAGMGYEPTERGTYQPTRPQGQTARGEMRAAPKTSQQRVGEALSVPYGYLKDMAGSMSQEPGWTPVGAVGRMTDMFFGDTADQAARAAEGENVWWAPEGSTREAPGLKPEIIDLALGPGLDMAGVIGGTAKGVKTGVNLGLDALESIYKRGPDLPGLPASDMPMDVAAGLAAMPEGLVSAPFEGSYPRVLQGDEIIRPEGMAAPSHRLKNQPTPIHDIGEDLIPARRDNLLGMGYEQDMAHVGGLGTRIGSKSSGFANTNEPELQVVGGDAYLSRDTIEARKQRRQELLDAEPVPVTPGPDAPYERWVEFGDENGVNLRVSPPEEVRYKGKLDDGTDVKGSITIPGGLKGTWTIADLFEMKANNFDPNTIPRELHAKLQNKLARTYGKIDTGDPVDVFNALNFGLLSPNTGLLPNEVMAARMRVRNDDELRQLASYADGLDLSKEPPRELSDQIARDYGLGSAAEGNLGAGGSVNFGRSAVMAKLLLEKPDLFKPKRGETLRDVAMRLQNQVPGFGTKASNLAVPWFDLKKGNTAAIDLHMIDRYWRKLLNDPEVGDQFRDTVARRMKVDPVEVEQSLEALGREPRNELLQGIINSQVKRQYRANPRKGADVGKLRETRPALQPDRLAFEPEKSATANPFYLRIFDYVEENAQKHGISTFQNQHLEWDRSRKRFEPHEVMHPDWRKLPRQAFGELNTAAWNNASAGYGGAGGATEPGKFTWQQLYYGNADPALLGGLAAGGGAAAAAPFFMGDDDDQ